MCPSHSPLPRVPRGRNLPFPSHHHNPHHHLIKFKWNALLTFHIENEEREGEEEGQSAKLAACLLHPMQLCVVLRNNGEEGRAVYPMDWASLAVCGLGPPDDHRAISVTLTLIHTNDDDDDDESWWWWLLNESMRKYADFLRERTIKKVARISTFFKFVCQLIHTHKIMQQCFQCGSLWLVEGRRPLSRTDTDSHMHIHSLLSNYLDVNKVSVYVCPLKERDDLVSCWGSHTYTQVSLNRRVLAGFCQKSFVNFSQSIDNWRAALRTHTYTLLMSGAIERTLIQAACR